MGEIMEKIIYQSNKTTVSYDLTLFILTYKRFDYLSELIDCLKKMIKSKKLNILVHISDNCSTDIPDKLSFCNEKLIDFPFDVLYTYNLNGENFVDNFNHCIDLCKSEYMSFCHDDDLLNYNYFVYCEKLLFDMNKKNISYMIPHYKIFKENLSENPYFCQKYKISKYKLKYMYYCRGNCFLAISCGAILKTDDAKSLKGLDVDKEPASDFDYVVRNLFLGNKVAKCKFITGYYRMFNNASSEKKIQYDARKCDLNILTKYKNTCLFSKILMRHFLYEIILDYSIRFNLDYNLLISNSNYKLVKAKKVKYILMKMLCKFLKLLHGIKNN